ncbi:MAG: 50S ribosomal protein L21 [Gammaproteobacteria bacterium]|nr:MAG: 50S ribosomal protein L21 [Gammaproteobacteria bacterium]
MYAVFVTGGKQYRASKGEQLDVEKLAAAEGDEVEFTDVLMIGEGRDLKVGAPKVAGGKVTARVVAQGRTDKVSVIKFKRRTTYKRIGSHRQSFTRVEITGITGGPPAGKE